MQKMVEKKTLCKNEGRKERFYLTMRSTQYLRLNSPQIKTFNNLLSYFVGLF